MTTAHFLRRLCRQALAPSALAMVLAMPVIALHATRVTAAALDEAPASSAAATAGKDAGESWVPTAAKVVNFVALVGVLAYFLRKPLANYLASRGDAIGKDLVEAKALRESASMRLGVVETRRAALPAEIETLRIRGREELARERTRIKQATAREREKVLEATKREIEVQFRGARRDLVAHTAEAAMKLARARIEASMTAEDQERLVDRYVSEVRP